jgi:hypothetical protein
MKLTLFALAFAALAAAQPVDPRSGRSEGKLQPGDAAPDFRLKRSGSEQQTALSGFGGKPVALVFGSYT